MQRYGLIGYPLGHSYSAAYFSDKFLLEHIDATYDLYPIASLDELHSVTGIPGLCGLNVTIPYKSSIIKHLESIDNEASTIGAVNCIKVTPEGLHGYNTDSRAFYDTIQPLLLPHHTHALILGTGGSSKAVAHAFNMLGIDFKTVSSSNLGDYTYDELNALDLHPYSILINCTPVGMHPHIDISPAFPYDKLNDNWLVYDLIYNPAQTMFLAEAAKQNAIIKNGLDMLHRQAELSWQIWTT